ncbi:MAG: peptidylprolyl isomerase [Oscillospiraceae bacterium]|nr:peptidylprolyl isomerase [Oscillospiraceae bacterium]
MKKVLCLLLALLLLVGSFAACSGTEEPTEPIGTEESTTEENGETEETTPAPSGGLLAGIDPTAVVLEIDGFDPVLWEEFHYELQRCRSIIENMGIIVDDWDAVFDDQPIFDETLTYNEFVIRFAIDATLERRAVESVFEESGATIDPDFYEEIRAMYLEEMGEEEFLDLLTEHFMTEDLFIRLSAISEMYFAAYEALTQEGGLVSEEEVETAIAEEGILRAKHILIAADEEGDAAATQRADELYQELQGLSGDELYTLFDELMAEYGEDPGMVGNPDGYTFMPGVMVPEFTEGTEALDYGEVGPPVRSDFGYHIILRLPVDPDAVVMSPHGGQETVHSMLAGGQIERLLEEAQAALVYETTALLDQIVPGEIFGFAGPVAEEVDEEDEPAEE